MHGHEIIDRRSLALHRLVAAKLRDNPGLIEIAKGNLERWLKTCSGSVRKPIFKWKAVLNGDLDGVLRILEQEDDEGQQMRQNTPFCGILTEDERNDIFARFRK